MSTVVATMHSDALSKNMDIVFAEWTLHESFRGFVTMIQACDFVSDKPRFIRESMKVEGWIFMDRSESSGTLLPIENENLLDSYIKRILEELDSQRNAPENSRNLFKFDNDSLVFNTKHSMSAESLFALPSNHSRTRQEFARNTSKRKFPTEGTRKSVTVETKLYTSTEGNVKRRYKRRNSVIRPSLGPLIMPLVADPTIEDIQRIVLANANAMEAKEEEYTDRSDTSTRLKRGECTIILRTASV